MIIGDHLLFPYLFKIQSTLLFFVVVVVVLIVVVVFLLSYLLPFTGYIQEEMESTSPLLSFLHLF